RAHPAATDPPVHPIPSAKETRRRGHRQGGAVGWASDDAEVVTGAALWTLVERLSLGRPRRRTREQSREAVADRHQEIFVLGAVWLLGSLRPHREQRFGHTSPELNRHEQLDARAAQPVNLLGWKLPKEPRSIIMWDLNGLLQPLKQARDFALGRQPFERRADRRHGRC